MQPELKVRKILGRTYLNENRLAEALEIFINILVDYPDDLESLLVLGGFYLAGGDGRTAKSLYLRARQLDPHNKTIERQIEMAQEMEGSSQGEPVPTDLDAVTRLLEKLTGKATSLAEDDILRAASLLEKIVNSPNPAELVARHLDEIDELLLALIELNIRQAQADGRPDVADGLRGLQLHIGYQRDVQDGDRAAQAGPPHSEAPPFTGSLLLLLPESENKSSRMSLLKTSLEARGCRVAETSEYVPGQDAGPGVVVTANPHTSPALIESLSALSQAGIPIVLDLDTDVENQPVSHPDYGMKGLSTHSRSRAYTAALALADMITVPSDVQAASLGVVGERVSVIPDGWSRDNRLWEKTPAPRSTINIGWAGSSGQLEDLISIRRFLIRIVREFATTRVVIIGNPQAYRLFDGLPENRRLYLPAVSHEEYPYLLGQLDVLVVPLRNLPYNHSLPDTVFMEAGARGIPWVASPIPAARRWQAGGMICESPDEWHLNLRHLVMDSELRSRLGHDGRLAARAREMDRLSPIWLDVLARAAALRAPAAVLPGSARPV